MADTDKTLLDPVEVLRTLAGSGAYVIVTFGSGATAKGSVVAADDDVSVLLDHDATASFVRHDSVLAVTVRDAHSFEGELGLPRPQVPAARVEEVASTPPFGRDELERLLVATGFEHDRSAVSGADARARAGLAALATAVDQALKAIVSDPAANESMQKDVAGVRLVDGVANSAAIEGTTLVVTSPWSQGPGGVYEPGPLREAILDAAR